MISEDVQRRVDAYRGNPGALAKRYQMTQELLDLLALQKLKTEKESAARELSLAMQQGEPPTVAQQREQEVSQMTKQEMAQQLGGLAKLAQSRPMMSGVASAPGAANAMPESAMAAGGIVAFQAGGEMPSENLGERQRRQLREKGSIYSPYFGLGLGELQDVIAQEVIDRQAEAEQARGAREAITRERVQAAARRASADRGTFAPEGKVRSIGEAVRDLLPAAPASFRTQMGSQNEARVPVVPVAERRDLGTSFPEEGTRVEEGARPETVTVTGAPSNASRPELGGIKSISPARTPQEIAGLLMAGQSPRGTADQRAMFQNLRDYQQKAVDAQFPTMTAEARAAREEAIRQQERRVAQEFDPQRRQMEFLRDFLLGGAGRTGIGSVFAGAGASGARSMASAEAAQREREDKLEAMREALRGRTEEEQRQVYMAKQKGLETALGAEKALLDLSVKMAEGDRDRGAKLAMVAQELATKEKLSRDELLVRVQTEAQKLGVQLDIADANRLVDISKVAAQREASQAQREETAEIRRQSQLGTNVRARLDDIGRLDNEFAKRRDANPILNQLLTKAAAGEPLKPEQAAQVDAYNRDYKRRLNEINKQYATLGVGSQSLQDAARAELQRRQQ